MILGILEWVSILPTTVAGVLAVLGSRMPKLIGPLLLVGLGAGLLLQLTTGLRWQVMPALALAAPLLLIARSKHRSHHRGDSRTWTRRIFSVLWRAALGLALILGLAPLVVFPMFSLPAPTGPHLVGTDELWITDTSRGETFTEDPTDRRHLPVRVWYPATLEGDSPVAPYWENADLLSPALAGQLGLPGFVFTHLGKVETHSRTGAPLADAADPFPVLLFSHGYSGTPTQSTFLMEELASHGYVVFSIGHPFESLPVEIDGRVAELRARGLGNPEAAMAEVEAVTRELATTEDARDDHGQLLRRITALVDLEPSFEIWVADGRLALDRIQAYAEDHPRFGGKLDGDRIGVFGHSFGGAMAAQICAVDPRCAAGINLDGGQFGSVVDSGVPVPFMFVYSEPSRWVNHSVHARSSGPSYQAAIMGSGHFNFADLPVVAPFLRSAARHAPVSPVGPIDPDRMFHVTNVYVRAFFDRYLKGQDSDLLYGPSKDYPEVRFEPGPAHAQPDSAPS